MRGGVRLRPNIGKSNFLQRYADSTESVQQSQFNQLTVESLPSLLRYEDRNSMRHGVESRLPFLDYRVVEAAMTLPVEAISRDGWSKFPLRKALASHNLPEVAWRRHKLGFQSPDSIWLKDYAQEMRDTIVRSQLLREISRERDLSSTVKGRHPSALWSMFAIARWAELKLN